MNNTAGNLSHKAIDAIDTTDSASDEQSQTAEIEQYFDIFYQPNELTIVCGALNAQRMQALAEAGVEHIINLQTDGEMQFDEATEAARHNMGYSHLPIADANDLKQVNLLAFDRILREQHGKKIAIHCKTGNRVGAVVALRAGWLRGRKMETALARGRAHGLQGLEEEVRMRLLVPR